MFRLVTLNLNGIRSAADKGFLPWAEQAGADCIGVQEVKAQAADVAGRFETVAGMPGHYHFAEKKGYSGVGLFTKKAPSDVKVGSKVLGSNGSELGTVTKVNTDASGKITSATVKAATGAETKTVSAADLSWKNGAVSSSTATSFNTLGSASSTLR